MTKNLLTCPMCGKPAALPWFNKFERTYCRCNTCRHIFVRLDERLVKQTVAHYDDGTIFLKDGNEDYYFDKTNLLSMELKLRWIKELYKGEGKLLDIGANFGHFLKTVQGHFDAQGIEISSYAVEWSKHHFGVNNIAASVDDWAAWDNGPYDVITMWDVIEHLPSWEPAMNNVSKALKPGGILFLTTPDSASLTARILGKHWHYLDPNQHLNLFSRYNLQDLLKAAGFEIVATRYIGHYYNLKYIMNRLAYLSSANISSAHIDRIEKIGAISGKAVYISLHDVLGMCARKRR